MRISSMDFSSSSSASMALRSNIALMISNMKKMNSNPGKCG
jgi:hypothetical protein